MTIVVERGEGFQILGRQVIEGLVGSLLLLPKILPDDGRRPGTGIRWQADDLAKDADFGVDQGQAVPGLTPPVHGLTIDVDRIQLNGATGQQILHGGGREAEAFTLQGPSADLGQEFQTLALQFFFASPLGPGGQRGRDPRDQALSAARGRGSDTFCRDGPAPTLAVGAGGLGRVLVEDHHGAVLADHQPVAGFQVGLFHGGAVDRHRPTGAVVHPQVAMLNLKHDLAGFLALVQHPQGAGLTFFDPQASAGGRTGFKFHGQGHGGTLAKDAQVATPWFSSPGRYHPAMPELPEVETVRRGLEALVLGAVIRRIALHRADLRRPMPLDLESRIVDQPITALRRRAKYLLLDTPAGTILSHLGMTGTWRVAEAARSHDHATLYLADGRRLVYRDPRRFGILDFVAPGAVSPDLADLGPEPLGNDFTPEHLRQVLAARRQAIKAVLLDQTVVSGVGNIYAQEACFRAGIRPQRPANRLRPAERERLVTEVRAVLAEAITAGGSTISDFRQAGGDAGYFQHTFTVYDRAGQSCRTCGGELKGATIAGRSTVWCPTCQR